MNKFLISTITGVALVVGALGMMEWFENPSSNFKNYAEMASSGIIKAGWVPNYIPRSAFEISETHNIDTNIVQMSFKFTPGDVALPRSNCHSETKEANVIFFLCNEGRLRLTNDGNGYFTNAPNDA
jgi:hypothetical protein